MFDKLLKLKNMGYYPDTILDIGAETGSWTRNTKDIFNTSNYYLFEPINYPELKQFDNDTNISVFHYILNDKIDDVFWYQNKNAGDSIYREKTFHFTNCDISRRKTIDLNTILLYNNFLQDSKNIFIKIDCQGSEIPILKGASDILSKTDFIVLEIPLFGKYNEGVPDFLKHIQFMNSIGFFPYDIVDNHYINGFNMQIDMLFINKNHNFNNVVNDLLSYTTIETNS